MLAAAATVAVVGVALVAGRAAVSEEGETAAVVGSIAEAVIGGWKSVIVWLRGGPPENGDDGQDDDDEQEEGEGEELLIVGGVPAVRLGEAAQRLAGIETARLEAVSMTPELVAIGAVIDVQPLLDLRADYRETYFLAEAAQIRLDAARREHERLNALYQDNANVAMKAVQQAEAVWKGEYAERSRLWDVLGAIRTRAERQWGPVLAPWAFDGEGGEFERLVRFEDSLLAVSLPAGFQLPGEASVAYMAANGERARAREVSYVSPSPRSARPIPGETHFFIVPGQSLAADMRVQLWVPTAASPSHGMALPPSAVITALGRSWTYRRIDDEHFVRSVVELSTLMPDGRYLVDSFGADDEVVVTGAVILLAEEFRSQIRDEDDD